MISRIGQLILLTGSLLSSPVLLAKGDAKAGAKLNATCVACHGKNGCSTNAALYPNIGGQPEAYLIKSLKAYKAGTRKDPVMSPMALVLTDDTKIANVAAFYAGQSGACK